MKMKRLTVVLAGMLALGGAVGCGGGGNSGGNYKPPVVETDWVRSTDNTDDIHVGALLTGIGEEWLKKVAQAYTDETGVFVDVFFDKGIGSAINISMDTGKNLDDLYLCGNTFDWLKWAAGGKAASLEDMMDLAYPNETLPDGTSNTLRNKIKENVYELGRYDEETYIVQLTYAPTGFVYNVDVLTQLGYDKFPETWAELLQLCKDVNAAKLTNKQGKIVRPMSWGGAVYDLNDAYKTLWAQSDPAAYEEFFEYSATSPDKDAWVSDARLKGMEAIYDLLAPVNGESSNSVQGLGGSTNVESEIAFLNGLSVFCPTGAWFESEVASALGNANFTYKFAPVPVIEGGQKAVNINIPTEYFFVPQQCDNVEGAKDFLRFMFSERNLKLMHETNQTPLAFEYDDSSLALSTWGQQVMDVLDFGTHVIAASSSEYYRVGALSARFNGPEPYMMIANGEVARTAITEKVLVAEYNQRATQWKDWNNMVTDITGN